MNMKRAALLVFVLQFHISAHAACSIPEWLVYEYGISFAGFKKEIPKATIDPSKVMPLADHAAMPLPTNDANIRDGYTHQALIDMSNKRAWILRTGGFAGVHEWYGPVALNMDGFPQCR